MTGSGLRESIGLTRRTPGGDPEGPSPYVAFREQIEQCLPFPTPSGRIEIYSQRLADWHDPLIPAIPRYLDHAEGPTDANPMRLP